MIGWHHWLNGHKSEQAPGDGEGQGSLTCCSPWGRKESDTTERLNNNKWKRPWCWERLRAGEEGGGRGWDGWMASPTQWTWEDKEAWRNSVHKETRLIFNWKMVEKSMDFQSLRAGSQGLWKIWWKADLGQNVKVFPPSALNTFQEQKQFFFFLHFLPPAFLFSWSLGSQEERTIRFSQFIVWYYSKINPCDSERSMKEINVFCVRCWLLALISVLK